MSTRTAVGWQTMLADLCLILFMVTAAAMAEKPEGTAPKPARPAPPPARLSDPARAEPLAVWRARPGGATLGQWLAAQAPDARAQWTIVARYRAGGLARAIVSAQGAAAGLGKRGEGARLILEPAAAGDVEVSASLAYDRPPQ